ncbi:mersacidin/lichenicidin family type 2 lantibiotic [Micromonospora globbae]|jgi:mersacidin/lichenicidin family type 2 lantibiotic|uniref:Mersacidin/lichenicidin family type 2 lantibiotic n=1 Tax=Micromonospora globbae TaxID=1894969 RepID=A0A420F8U8_9ACTN|nr:mersacidin/lichenicidin family type 2 lantibiotic [Micromonospora globbae]RKF29316.1 mersacidin/lichenicidin family type 2 lantibiotic [Micromonospora globbae]WTF84403.1 mersacidin/lichenicidin family type 2 lantibiotic [Micromonospora globbae]
MSITDIVNGWKDEYRRAAAPEAAEAHPVGVVELDRDQLETVAGGAAATTGHTTACCHCVC